MKEIAFISILIITTQISWGQKIASRIDSINSKEDIQKLIQSLKGGEKFALTVDTLYNQPFCKTDFDKNGFTDLLAIGGLPEYISGGGRDGIETRYYFHALVVMNFGKDSFEIRNLSRSLIHSYAIIKIVNDTIITMNQNDLIFKFGDFIEFNSHPKTYEIDKVEYQTTGCYGFCPVFRIEISKDKTGTFEAKNYNSRAGIPILDFLEGKEDSALVKGTFKTVVNDDSYSNIIALLNYIDFPNLKDDYSVHWTDDQSCLLKITYDNGKEKRISDYGLIGTYGLDRLYQLFFELRFNQNWK